MTEKSPGRYFLNSDQVQKYLPQRPPFLMIDRVLEINPTGSLSNLAGDSSKEGIRVVTQKCVSVNEPHFVGHFPGFALMPGVLLIEAMAQTASFSLYPYLEKDIEKLSREFQCVLVGVDGARFRRPVVPGDVLIIESKVTKCRGKLWIFDVQVTVENQKVAEAQIMANLLLKGDGLERKSS